MNGSNVKEIVYNSCGDCPILGALHDNGNKQWTQTGARDRDTTTTKQNMIYHLVEQQRDVRTIVLYDTSRNATVTVNFSWMDRDEVRIHTKIPTNNKRWASGYIVEDYRVKSRK